MLSKYEAMRGSWTLDFHHSLVNLSLIFRIMALIMTLFPVSANTTSSHKQNKNLKEFTKNFPAGCFTSVCAQSKNCISHYNSVNKGIIVKKLCKKFCVGHHDQVNLFLENVWRSVFPVLSAGHLVLTVRPTLISWRGELGASRGGCAGSRTARVQTEYWIRAASRQRRRARWVFKLLRIYDFRIKHGLGVPHLSSTPLS